MKFKMIHENFNVTDLDRSLAFYEKALGLHEVRRKPAADGAHIICFLANESAKKKSSPFLRNPKNYLDQQKGCKK